MEQRKDNLEERIDELEKEIPKLVRKGSMPDLFNLIDDEAKRQKDEEGRFRG